MNKNIIIAGKEFSKNTKVEQLAKQAGFTTFITTRPTAKNSEKPEISLTNWNRNTPISARTVVLNAENQFGKIDGAVLFFDTAAYNQIFTETKLEDFDRACSEIILSYNFLTAEIIKHFTKKQHGLVFFVLQEMQTNAEFMKLSSREQLANPDKAFPIASMAQAAFKAFAENMAASLLKDSESFVYLLEAGRTISEKQIIDWISKKIEEPNPVYKTTKQAVTWLTVDEKSKFPFIKG